MAIAVSDSFDRADNPTSLGTADTGQVWAQVPGQNQPLVGSAYGILSNQAFNADSGGAAGDSLVVVDTGLSDFYAEFVVGNASAGGGNNLRNYGIVFRYFDEFNYMFLTFASAGGGLFRLYVANNGNPTHLGPTSPTSMIDGDVIGVACCGGVVTAYKNDVVATNYPIDFDGTGLPVLVSNVLTATKVGLMSGSQGSGDLPLYNDFLVETVVACGTPTYNCTGGACVDPGDGSGTYATLAACLAGCGVDESYNCVSGVCVDPGDGSGDFATLLECELSGCTPRVAETMRFDAGEGSDYYVVAQVSDSDDELRSKTLKSIRTTGIRTNVSGMAYGYDVNQEISTDDLETGTRTNTRMTTRPQDFSDSTGVTQSERKQINVANAVLSTVRIEGDDTGNEQRDRIDEIVVEQAKQGVRR